MSPKNFFQKIKKTIADVIFSGLGLGLERVGLDYSPIAYLIHYTKVQEVHRTREDYKFTRTQVVAPELN